MSLDSRKIALALEIWRDYVAGGERFINASEEYTHDQLDTRRREVIPEVKSWLDRFLSGEVQLDEFKTAVDGVNKRNRLWGFRGTNGQMFFNLLVKSSSTGNHLPELVGLLRQTLPAPSDLAQTRLRVKEFQDFTKRMGEYSPDPRSAPKIGSIPFFLSYFWQIQEPEKFPVYYTSMVQVLDELDMWSPTGQVADDYGHFYELNHDILALFSHESGRGLHLWDIEHAFWFRNHGPIESGSQPPMAGIPQPVVVPRRAEENLLPESYIPPVVSIIPRLAINDPSLVDVCDKAGHSIEKVFEERLAVLFGMLGYDVEPMGQGHGRMPDGIAVCKEYHYAILFDAKVRQGGYTMGTDDRAIREYIAAAGDRLRRQGIRTLYFMIISSKFTGDHDDAIRGLKMDTDVREVLLVEATALLTLLEGKFRNSDLTLGPDGVQRLLTSSGPLTEADIREFLGV